MVFDEVPGTGRHKTIRHRDAVPQGGGHGREPAEGADGGWMSVFTEPIKSF